MTKEGQFLDKEKALRFGVPGVAFALGLWIAWGICGPNKVSSEPETEATRDLAAWAAERNALAQAIGGETSSSAKMRRLVNFGDSGLAVQLVDLMRLVRETPAEELGELLEEMYQELNVSFLGENVCGAIFDRMKIEVPEVVIEMGFSGKSHFLNEELSDVVEVCLKEEGIDGLIQRAGRIESPAIRAEKLRSAFFQMSEEDTAGALAKMKTLDPEMRRAVEPGIVSKLARNGNEQALEEYVNNKGAKLSTEVLVNGLAAMATKNPDAALALLGQVPKEAGKGVMLAHLAKGWAGSDKDAALAYAEKIESPLLKSYFLAGVIQSSTSWREQEENALIERIPLKSLRNEVGNLDNWSIWVQIE